jgi:hypothetical protein
MKLLAFSGNKQGYFSVNSPPLLSFLYILKVKNIKLLGERLRDENIIMTDFLIKLRFLFNKYDRDTTNAMQIHLQLFSTTLINGC